MMESQVKMKRVTIGCTCVVAVPLLLIVLTIISGILSSGTWYDDSENWQRAFGSKKPDSVEVLRSHYWKSSHWTYEAAYCFKLRMPDAQLNEMKEGLHKRKSTTVDYRYLEETPAWFPENGKEADEIWLLDSERESFDHFIMIVDKKDNTVYIADWQV